MKTILIRTLRTMVLAVLLAGSAVSFCQPVIQPPDGPGQKVFASAEAAVAAMVEALKAGDGRALNVIFGRGAKSALSSGDRVADKRAVALFLAAYGEDHLLVDQGDTMILNVGKENWPFPIPLVKDGPGWRFDTAAGIQELNYRRIGRNELAAISLCRTCVEAQKQYFLESHNGPAGVYARKFISTPGTQDGLFWRTLPDEEPSPLGKLAAEAELEGYTAPQGGKARPFRGYYFKILTGDKNGSYLVDGAMLNGFALVAYPAEYGKSGIMSFMVNQEGTVYESDLGEDTSAKAEAMKIYDPDSDWKVVD